MNTADCENTRLLTSLGLCAKAGKVVYGVPMICEAMQRGGKYAPRLVLEVSDTSEATHKKITDKCKFYGVRHVRVTCGGAVLADALGKSAFLGAVALTDAGMCRMIEKYI